MDFFTLENFLTLLMIIFLQAVLGIDNLLYIAIESKHAPAEKQRTVRFWGIIIAIVLRILLLFALVGLLKKFTNPLFSLKWDGYVTGEFNLHALIVFLGGAFVVYTSIKEIWHLIAIDDRLGEVTKQKPRSLQSIIIMIVIMNIVFSFDSILSAMALTKNIWTMMIAMLAGGFMMLWLSGKVAKFLQKNRKFEVLGLFILFLVGIMLVSDSGHLAKLTFFNNEVHAMNKTTFYFTLFTLIIVDMLQTKFKKKIKYESEKQQTDIPKS